MASPASAAQTAVTTTSDPSHASPFFSAPPVARSGPSSSGSTWLTTFSSGCRIVSSARTKFVWTIPKALRGFLRRDRSLFAAIGKLIFALITEYYAEAAGRPVVTGMVSSHQTFGEYATWHPHWHTIVLEGGFDSHDRFFFIPIGASEALQELWRRRVIGFFLKQGLLDSGLAESMLGWQHSGFSVEPKA